MGLFDALDSLVGFVSGSVDAIGTLLDFLFIFIKWLFFFISSPSLLIMGVLIFAFGIALVRAKDIFTFFAVVFGVVFPFLGALVSVVVMLLNVLISFIRLLIPSK